jgi:creatinine amidohydrolase/Fe(II)-dependent formamide hydrolase-like protein
LIRFCLGLVIVLLVAGTAPAAAEIVRITDLNTAAIRALDRSKTVVILTGGMLEEHGPYLPAFTDGILSDRLTSDQGFRWIFVVHVHGSPMHIRAIDQAGDFFHDTYGGRMVNLWGLVPVLGGWGSAMQSMTDAEKQEDGVSLHAGMDEHSLMLHLQPALVAAGFKNANAVAGRTMADSFERAKAADWPGYLGSPRIATAAWGEKIWKSFAAAAVDPCGQDPGRRRSGAVSAVRGSAGPKSAVPGVDQDCGRAGRPPGRSPACMARAETMSRLLRATDDPTTRG